MIVHNNVFATLNPENIYISKQCSCGSDLDVQVKDIIDLIPNEDNIIKVVCPCCGREVPLRKYGGGKIYTIEEYSRIAELYKSEMDELDKYLIDASCGFYNEFVALAEIDIFSKLGEVTVLFYVSIYEEGNWKKELNPLSLRRTIHYDFSSKVVCHSPYEYAKYSQALADCITQLVKKNSELSAYLKSNTYTNYDGIKNAIIDVEYNPDNDYYDPIKRAELAAADKKAKKTIFIPDVAEATEHTANEIGMTGNNIKHGLYAVAFSLMNSESMENPF